MLYLLMNPQIDFSLVDYAIEGEKLSSQNKESNKMKKKTELMWEYVFSIIDGLKLQNRINKIQENPAIVISCFNII